MPSTSGQKRIMNAGSGASTSSRMREFFPVKSYKEIRVDIDPSVDPDIVASLCDMRDVVEDESFDVVWSSHSLEHLCEHEAPLALAEFRRVLRPDGLAIVTCPDLAAVARRLQSDGVDSVAYVSSAGPIRLLDILFGHGPSIAAGRRYMAHCTGFTAARLGRLATAAGFAEARVVEGDNFDIWAALLMPRADAAALARAFDGTRLAPLFPEQVDATTENAEAEPQRPPSYVRRLLNPAPVG
jgi:SAM-dependent methyltransferase